LKSSSRVPIIVLICIGFLGLVGILADVGNIYFERRYLSQATGGAALKAANFLPREEEAHEVVLAFLEEAAYGDQNWEEVEVIINAEDVTEQILELSERTKSLTIWIDTSFSRISDTAEAINTANSIRVSIRKEVPTIFLWLFGVRRIWIEDTAEVKGQLNIMMTVVSDISGSAKIGTLCGNFRGINLMAYNWSQCNERDTPNIYETVDDAIRANLATDGSLTTDIITGMRASIAMFGSASGEYEHSRALHRILIITDRTPNVVPDDEVEGRECWQEDLWISADSEDENHSKAADCAIYYTEMAAENNILIWVINVGDQVDQKLMQEIADGYRWLLAVDELKEFHYEHFLFGTGPRLVE